MLNFIKNANWIADWSGPFCLLEVSTSPRVYFNGLKNVFGKSFNHFFVIYRNGVVSSYFLEDDCEEFGQYLKNKINNFEDSKIVAERFIQLADEINEVVNLPSEKFLKNLESNSILYQDYGAHNIGVKTFVDVAGDNISEEMKEILTNSRRYSENFYKNNAKAFFNAIELMAKETGYSQENIFMMTREELLDYLNEGKMPSKEILTSRYKYSGVYANSRGEQVILSGDQVAEIEKAWTKNKGDVLIGTSAYAGKVRGKCRVIMNYKDIKFNEGEILVTGMTDPDYISIMKKSAAIITDGGGVLSHAAIVAREMKKPCIIGTKIATQVLKDGDEVEVDAEKGIVKILNRKDE